MKTTKLKWMALAAMLLSQTAASAGHGHGLSYTAGCDTACGSLLGGCDAGSCGAGCTGCDSANCGAGSGLGCDSACATSCEALTDCNGSCGGSCASCCGSGGHWYTSVEATFLAPLYDNGVANFGLFDIVGGTTTTLSSGFDENDELTGGPRVTLGWVSDNGIGIQGRYWELNNGLSVSPLPTLLAGNQLQLINGADAFEAYTIDLELTKDFCRRGWDLLGTFGVRHGAIEHQRTQALAGVVNTDTFLLTGQQGEEFHGTGLTASLSGLRTLNRCKNLAFYGSMRGSTLWGGAKTLAVATSSVASPFGTASTINGALDLDDETMFITEFQAGLQWSRCVKTFNARMFARAGFEYQYWDTQDGRAQATAASGSIGQSAGVAQVSGGEHETDLVGFTVGTGFVW